MKTRVKCANCGMVYDIEVGFPLTEICPSCKSNAYDNVEKKSNYREYEDWKKQ